MSRLAYREDLASVDLREVNLSSGRWSDEYSHGKVPNVVVTAREQPFDMAFARSPGNDCSKMKHIALKSAAHFRAAFEPIAGSIHNIDAAGIHTHDFSQLPLSKRTRDVCPIETKPPAL